MIGIFEHPWMIKYERKIDNWASDEDENEVELE
jgi:hypothetical protein